MSPNHLHLLVRATTVGAFVQAIDRAKMSDRMVAGASHIAGTPDRSDGSRSSKRLQPRTAWALAGALCIAGIGLRFISA